MLHIVFDTFGTGMIEPDREPGYGARHALFAELENEFDVDKLDLKANREKRKQAKAELTARSGDGEAPLGTSSRVRNGDAIPDEARSTKESVATESAGACSYRSVSTGMQTSYR